MTAAADAVAEIPRSCCCAWRYDYKARHWIRTAVKDGCPWHTKGTP